MAKPDQLKISTTVVVDLPADKFDLPGWAPNFTTEEYIACTPGTGAHKFMYVYRGEDGKNIYRNDESCGPIVMTQLYREEIMERQHIFLVSPQTKARMFGFWPMTIQITWDMKVEPFDANRSKFTCTLGSRLNVLYLIASFFIRFTFWGQAHCDEETPHFAESAARWATRNETDRPVSFVSPAGG